MKKIFTAFILLLVCFGLHANPLPYPYCQLSEFMIEEDGSWVLEIYNPRGINEDVVVTSSSGEMVLDDIRDKEYLVIKSKDVQPSFNINIEGDSITLIGDEWRAGGMLTFGNYPNAMIEKPKPGYSIAFVPFEESYNDYGESRMGDVYYLCRCSNPTIGMENDQSASVGFMKGKLVNPDAEILAGSYIGLQLRGNLFKINKDGYFEAEISAGRYSVNSLSMIPYSINIAKWYEIEPVYIDIQPGETIEQDIYLAKPRSIEISSAMNSLIRVYPNPMGKDKKITYEVDLPVNTMDVEMEVFSMAGQLLLKNKITSSSGTVDLSQQSEQQYVVVFKSGNKILYSTKLLISE